MTDETIASPADDEISLLDLLLVIAENARLLIFGPILAGLAGAAGLIDRFKLMAVYDEKYRQEARANPRPRRWSKRSLP